MKIALGTVQFGMQYGIANKIGYIQDSELIDILQLAINKGIDTLDTAINYGDSEYRLGFFGVNNLKVVSKLPEVPISVVDVREWTRDQVKASIKRLNISKLHGLLLHRPNQLTEQRGEEVYRALLNLKEEGLVGKIGISIYDPIELAHITSNFVIDLVQLPLNILDRRMQNSGWIEKLSVMGIEVHVRSIFLQGLLLMERTKRPHEFSRWNYIWDEWDNWLFETGQKPLEACLRYATSIPGVDKVVVGVDSVQHLEEVLSISNNHLLVLPNFPEQLDPMLINPSKWKIN